MDIADVVRRADENTVKALGRDDAIAWLLERACECDKAAKGHKIIAKDYRARAKALRKSI